jgi:hypothetical protein
VKKTNSEEANSEEAMSKLLSIRCSRFPIRYSLFALLSVPPKNADVKMM